MGVLYVLDEPSIGLHQRDNRKLIDTLLSMRDLGNTVDRRRARRGDDPLGRLGRGPGPRARACTAGRSWSRRGRPRSSRDFPESLTARYLSGEHEIPTPAARRAGSGKALTVRGAREHNLKAIDVRVPARRA